MGNTFKLLSSLCTFKYSFLIMNRLLCALQTQINFTVHVYSANMPLSGQAVTFDNLFSFPTVKLFFIAMLAAQLVRLILVFPSRTLKILELKTQSSSLTYFAPDAILTPDCPSTDHKLIFKLSTKTGDSHFTITDM